MILLRNLLARGLWATFAALLAIALPAQVRAQALTVSAAASLTQAFKDLTPAFEAAHPGVTLRLNFAASGLLLQQIRQGAPVDVLATADEETMTRGIEAKLIDAGTRRAFAANTVVLIAPADGAPALTRLEDLSRSDVRRIAIGKPDIVPAGRYTRQGLEAAALWSALQPRYVYGDSVRQVLDYVARGEAQAGFVYRTDAGLMPDKVRVVATLGGHAPVRYPAAVVADSRHAAAAQAFVAFLLSPAAQATLARHGFGRP